MLLHLLDAERAVDLAHAVVEAKRHHIIGTWNLALGVRTVDAKRFAQLEL
jgi:hypothetical protein